GADVRYFTEVVDFAQDEHGVTASIQDRSTRESRQVRASYLVAADGAHSGARAQLQIAARGKGTLDEHYVFLYARGPWSDLVRGYEADAFLIENPYVRVFFMNADEGLGMFVVPREHRAPDLNRAQAQEIVDLAIGRADFRAHVFEVAPWRPEQRVA